MKACIYTRVSTAEQSLDSQIDVLKQYCKNENIEIAGEFSDTITGESKQLERKGFEEMNNFLLLNPEVKNVIVYEYSRLGRSFVQSHNTILEFQKRGINIFFKKENLNTLNPTSNESFSLNILSSIAEYERSTIKERTRRGRNFKIVNQQGVQSGSLTQYGYKKENNKQVIDEKEADVIRMIFKMYLEDDYSTPEIAAFLNSQNIPTRFIEQVNKGEIEVKNERLLRKNQVWTDGTVARLMKKRILVGYRTHQKKELPYNKEFQIIDEKTFNEASKKLASRKKGSTVAEFPNVLRGVIKCDCGANYMMNKGKGVTSHHYVCYNKTKKTSISCNSNMIDIDTLNNLVYFYLKDAVKNDEEVSKRINDFRLKIDALNINNRNLNDKLDEFKADLKRVLLSKLKETNNDSIEIYEGIESDLKLKLADYKSNIAKNEEAIKSYNKEIEKLNSSVDLKLSNPEIFKKFANKYINSIRIKTIEKNELLKQIFPKVKHSLIYHISIDAGIYGYSESIVNINQPHFLMIIGHVFDENFNFIGGTESIELTQDEATGLAIEKKSITPMYLKANLPDVIKI